ncbi:hypothetical protein [Methylorubrum extorquens]|uniref:hypothetical protein n=1 Tax=Methylorubrum extorquens TaxID=408 RepID=UPI0005A52D8D|nr:hypothetical protein [Methylorubrum extorquens]
MRRSSLGDALAFGRQASINGSNSPHCASDSITPTHLKTRKRQHRQSVQATTGSSTERLLAVEAHERLHRYVTEAKREMPLIALRNPVLVAVAYDALLRRWELISQYRGDLQSGDLTGGLWIGLIERISPEQRSWECSEDTGRVIPPI